MQVKDLMTREVVTVPPSASLQEAAGLLVAHGISGVPVVEHGRVVGVLSERDFLVKEQGRPETSRWLAWLTNPLAVSDQVKLAARTVRDAMTAPALTVTPSASVAKAAKRMLEGNVSRLPVLDGEGLVGIVTRADLIRAFSRSDPELEAEIEEEVLGRQLWLDPDAVQISVDHGNVTVETHDAGVEPEILERFVSEVPGVVSVTVR